MAKRRGVKKIMGMFDEFHDCKSCNRRYHQWLMIAIKNKYPDHLCIRCYNFKDEHEKEREKTNTLQSNDYSEDKKVA